MANMRPLPQGENDRRPQRSIGSGLHNLEVHERPSPRGQVRWCRERREQAKKERLFEKLVPNTEAGMHIEQSKCAASFIQVCGSLNRKLAPLQRALRISEAVYIAPAIPFESTHFLALIKSRLGQPSLGAVRQKHLLWVFLLGAPPRPTRHSDGILLSGIPITRSALILYNAVDVRSSALDLQATTAVGRAQALLHLHLGS